MTNKIGNRIKIQDLIDTLENLTFDTVNSEALTNTLESKVKVIEVFPWDIKDIEVDDYYFTISRYPVEQNESKGLHISDMILSDYVEVFLPYSIHGEDNLQAEGRIMVEKGKAVLSVNYIVD